MILVKEKNNIYPAGYITKITTSESEIKYIAISFRHGVIIKFFFDDNDKLLTASKKIEDTLLKDKGVTIDQNYLEATATNCNV